MFGAILGDIIGSPYEFDMGEKKKDFPLFSYQSVFTDDTVMTIAVLEALLMSDVSESDEVIKERLIDSMKKWGNKYPYSGYGGRFYHWLFSDDRKPYNSYGNGSAMRVSAAGFLYDTLEDTKRMAKLTAEVTHNHIEGIKGAEATACMMFLLRNNKTKEEVKTYVENEFHYDLSRTLDEIRPGYHHVESCMETVPEAITAFLESESFEDAIRNAVSLGGDTDTLGAITGAIAESCYEVPEELKIECMNRIPEEMKEVLLKFQERMN